MQWRRLTNWQAADFDAAVQYIEWYRARWDMMARSSRGIVLRCNDSIRQAFLTIWNSIIALYLVVAWRIARLMRLGRTCPDLPADMFFDVHEWKAAYVLSKKPIPKTPPRLNEVIRRVAGLGGFLGRKCDGEPGAKTLWLGLQRITDFAAGRRYARAIDEP